MLVCGIPHNFTITKSNNYESEGAGFESPRAHQNESRAVKPWLWFNCTTLFLFNRADSIFTLFVNIFMIPYNNGIICIKQKRKIKMLINIENVSYIYRKNKLKALKNIDLKFSEHQTHAVLGHNGAGKTTLFLLMSGYLKLQSGRITYNSKFIDNKKEIVSPPEYN